MIIQLQFYIDVSGQPKSTVSIGLVSIKNNDGTILIKNIKIKKPNFFRNRQKCSRMKANEIDSLVKFMNGNGVRMVNIKLKGHSWNELLNFIGHNKQYKIEKIFAILYFIALKKYSQPYISYPATLCVESFMNINKVTDYLREIAKANKYNFQIAIAQVKNCDMLKFADIVAGSVAKSPTIKYDFLHCETPELSAIKFYLNKIK